MVNTTLKVTKKTKDELDKLKIHPRQSYEEIINKLIKERKNEKNLSK